MTLGTLNRKAFTIILHRAQKKKINYQISTLRQYRLCSDLSWLKLQKICYLLEEKNFSKGAVLFNQGEKVHGCYFISEGQVLYKRKLSVQAYEQRKMSNIGTSEGTWINNQSLI